MKTRPPPQDLMVIGFPDYREPAQALAEALHSPYGEASLHRFPDGESILRLPSRLPSRVALVRSLDWPNDKLLEMLLAVETARQLGAEHVTLVAPYLCYMRQDIAFQAGEAVSQRIVGKYLAQLFDGLVTVDPHLHRIRKLDEAIPLGDSARALTAAPLLGALAADQLDQPILLGPDEEAAQWVMAVAGDWGFDWGVCRKRRHGDRDVDITLPEMDFDGRDVVLIDDVASSGETLARCAEVVFAAGAGQVCAMVTHALFAEGALQRVTGTGVSRVWSTDSIPHSSNSVALTHLLAAGVSQVLAEAEGGR